MVSDHDGTVERTDARRRFSRYDLILAAIPTAFLLAVVAGRFLSIPTHVVLTGATGVGVLALVDGLFVNPPRSGSGAA